MGWRLVYFTAGAIVFVMSLSRVLVVRLKETPKYLLGQGRDADVVDNVQGLAKRYNRPCDLTLEQLQAYGDIVSSETKQRPALHVLMHHIKGLLATRRLALSTLMVWFSWTLIGLAYPLFYVFLPCVLSIFACHRFSLSNVLSIGQSFLTVSPLRNHHISHGVITL